MNAEAAGLSYAWGPSEPLTPSSGALVVYQGQGAAQPERPAHWLHALLLSLGGYLTAKYVLKTSDEAAVIAGVATGGGAYLYMEHYGHSLPCSCGRHDCVKCARK
jgi:hypothetical protein